MGKEGRKGEKGMGGKGKRPKGRKGNRMAGEGSFIEMRMTDDGGFTMIMKEGVKTAVLGVSTFIAIASFNM